MLKVFLISVRLTETHAGLGVNGAEAVLFIDSEIYAGAWRYHVALNMRLMLMESVSRSRCDKAQHVLH
ncbi:hypothetical protein MHYP_G00331120 [Metynnis hypsauchen]